MDKAEARQDDTQESETADLHNYMWKQSLVNEAKCADKEKTEAAEGKAAATEKANCDDQLAKGDEKVAEQHEKKVEEQEDEMAEMQDYQPSSEKQLLSSLQSAASPWWRQAGLLLLAHGTICRTEAFVEETEKFSKVSRAGKS